MRMEIFFAVLVDAMEKYVGNKKIRGDLEAFAVDVFEFTMLFAKDKCEISVSLGGEVEAETAIDMARQWAWISSLRQDRNALGHSFSPCSSEFVQRNSLKMLEASKVYEFHKVYRKF